MTPNPLVFISYVQHDDEFERGTISRLRNELAHTIRFVSGYTVDIFQERTDIAIGQRTQERISQSLNEAMVLIPVLTPSFFKDPTCQAILTRFLERERQLGRDDLVLPVYYQRVPDLNSAQESHDRLLQDMAQRRMVDWQALRGKDFDDPQVRHALDLLARRITTILSELETGKETDMPIAAPGDVPTTSSIPTPPDAPPVPPTTDQQIDNPASNRGAQGNFYGPVNIYQGDGPVPEPQDKSTPKRIWNWIGAHPGRIALVGLFGTLVAALLGLFGNIVVGILTFFGALWGGDTINIGQLTPVATNTPLVTPTAATSACDYDGEDAATYFHNQGMDLLATGDRTEAIESFKCALQVAPDQQATLYQLARTYDADGEEAEAEQSYQDAASYGFAPAANELLYRMLEATVPEHNLSEEQRTAAERYDEDLHRALRDDDLTLVEEFVFHKNRGWYAFVRGRDDFDDALRHLDQAVDLAELYRTTDDFMGLPIASPYCLRAQIYQQQARNEEDVDTEWRTCCSWANSAKDEERAWRNLGEAYFEAKGESCLFP